MRPPSDAEAAAIAAAYAVLLRRDVAAHAPPPSRWRLAARVPELEAANAPRVASRWTLAGRLDD